MILSILGYSIWKNLKIAHSGCESSNLVDMFIILQKQKNMELKVSYTEEIFHFILRDS
jgi:hypothetical protein